MRSWSFAAACAAVLLCSFQTGARAQDKPTNSYEHYLERSHHVQFYSAEAFGCKTAAALAAIAKQEALLKELNEQVPPDRMSMNANVDKQRQGYFQLVNKVEMNLAALRNLPPCAGQGLQWFIGGEIGGGFGTTTFNVMPSFDINSGGFIYGVNGGFLVPLPMNNGLQVGVRAGLLGGPMTGGISGPVASPRFEYDVKDRWQGYIEALIREEAASPASWLPPFRTAFFTASAGVAEVNTQVNGRMGNFSVTDTMTRPGFTFSVGAGMPVTDINGHPVDVTLQYRGTYVPSGTVNIPGSVGTSAWANAITLGSGIRY
jgi:hypothetical protein